MQAAWPEALRHQVQVLVDQFLGNAAWIGIDGIATLGVHGGFGTMRLGGRLEALGSQPLARAFVWVQGTEPKLRVSPTDPGYRALFDEFAKARLSLPGRPMGSGWNIDHAFPKAVAAADGLSHVRLLAIAAGGNQAAGRTLEKAMAGRAATARGRKRIRQATWMTIGKAAGFEGWTELPDEAAAGNAAVVRRLFDHLAAHGITAPAGALEEQLTAATLGRIR